MVAAAIFQTLGLYLVTPCHAYNALWIIHLSQSLSLYLSTSLSLYQSIYLSIYLSLYQE